MNFSFTQVAVGITAAGTLAIGTWGINTEISNRSQDAILTDHTNQIQSNEETGNKILQELMYIRGKVDTIAEHQEEIKQVISMSKEKLAVMLDGGLGRVLCAIPALQELSKQHELVVVSGGWLSAFQGSGLTVYPMKLANQADLLDGFRIIKPEPYWELCYRNGTMNLVEAFNASLGVKTTAKVPFETDTRSVGSIVKSSKPILILQPHGAGGEADTRSMLLEEVVSVVNEYKETHNIFIVGTPFKYNFPKEHAQQVEKLTEGAYIRTIQNCDLFVGCDSSGLHIAAAAGVKHIAYLATTSGVRYYDDTDKRIRKGYEDMRLNPRLQEVT